MDKRCQLENLTILLYIKRDDIAFDSISREALLYKLSTLGIDGKFINV